MKNTQYMLSLLNVKQTKKGFLDVKGTFHETIEAAAYDNLVTLLEKKVNAHYEMIDYLFANSNAIAPYVQGLNLLQKKITPDQK